MRSGLYLIRMDPVSPDGEYEISVSCEPVITDSPAAVDTPTPTPEAEGLADLHTDEANLAESETPVPPQTRLTLPSRKLLFLRPRYLPLASVISR